MVLLKQKERDMKTILLTLLLALFSQCLLYINTQAATEDNTQAATDDSTEIQNNKGLPLSGVGRVCRIDLNTNELCINDYIFSLVETTQFLNEDGTSSSSKAFQPETLVRFLADENGEMVSLWLYSDPENEYSLNKSDNETKNESGTTESVKKNKKRPLIKENGVWQN